MRTLLATAGLLAFAACAGSPPPTGADRSPPARDAESLAAERLALAQEIVELRQRLYEDLATQQAAGRIGSQDVLAAKIAWLEARLEVLRLVGRPR